MTEGVPQIPRLTEKKIHPQGPGAALGAEIQEFTNLSKGRKIGTSEKLEKLEAQKTEELGKKMGKKRRLFGISF